MHEYSIVQALYDQIVRNAGARGATAVRRVKVRIGRSSGVEPALLETAYDLFRVRTLCADAPLEIEEVPTRWGCPRGHGDVPAGTALRCAVCDRPAVLLGGDEIVLEQLELEVP
jgi:hydrogenase nickel incorporation protein HypA/HybF